MEVRFKKKPVTPDKQFDEVVFVLCSSAEQKIGHIWYNSEDGVDFSTTNQTMNFRNLKTKLIRHLKKDFHTRKAGVFEETKHDLMVRNKIVGLNLGRLAYLSIRNHGSYLQYEETVSTVSKLKGVDVGELNHGHDFCSSMVQSLYTVLKEKLKEVVNEEIPATGRPPPFAVMADKITTTKRPFQAIAINTYVDGRVQQYFTNYTVVCGDHTAQNLCPSIVADLHDYFGPEIKNR